MGELIEFTPSPSTNPSAPRHHQPTPQTPATRTPPFREDCWSEDATWTLVNAWGGRFVDLNRGNLRQKDWQFVADSVNSVHGHDVKSRRTDIQCKNRIDTLKKKYKAERNRMNEGGSAPSVWPFYNRMDELIGCVVSGMNNKSNDNNNNNNNNNSSNGNGNNRRVYVSASVGVDPPMGIPLYRKLASTVAPMAAMVATPASATPVTLKRAAPSLATPSPVPVVDDSYFRRNYSAVAAAAAAQVEDGDDVDDSDSSEEETEEVADGNGMKRLARAIERLGDMYERVEAEKQKQTIELEKQRMRFAKEMEVQKMQLFMDTQIQIEKIKQAKRARTNGEFCS